MRTQHCSSAAPLAWALGLLMGLACSDPPPQEDAAPRPPSAVDAAQAREQDAREQDAREQDAREQDARASPPLDLDAAPLEPDLALDAAPVALDRALALDLALDAAPVALDMDLDAALELDLALDAAPPWDMESQADMSWGGCASGGVAGRCLQIDDCPADHRRVQGLCPGPWDIQCCLPSAPVGGDAGLACDPWAQPNEGLIEPVGQGGCPPGMAPIEGFCMDRFEAALVDLDGRPWSPFQNPGEAALLAVSIPGAIPQGYINGHQAEAACARAGKRLCSDVEWLRACQGVAGWTFPYGDAREWGRCNDHRALHPAVELHPEADNPFNYIQDPCINQLPEGLAEAGAYAGCLTPEGVYDLVGGLHEWTSNPDGVFRGGFYVDTERNGPGCLYRTTAHNRWHWDYSTGFRCCADQPL
ncbi:formylglycine-generating enzyme family protein [Myxococcota bacterium]|nr:formylglycine-generating enzyme family protein [Myxococcota bacterium]